VTPTDSSSGYESKYDQRLADYALAVWNWPFYRPWELSSQDKLLAITLLSHAEGFPMPDYSVFCEDTVQAAFYSSVDNRPMLTSLTFKRIGGAPVLADTQLLANDLADYWILRVEPLLSVDHRFDFCIVVPLNGDFTLIWGSTNAPEKGGIGGLVMPNNVAFRLELSTGVAGRPYHGWNSFTGLSRTVITKNTVVQTWADDLANVWSGVGPLANALGWEWVVTSTRFAGAPRVAGIMTPITQVYYKDLTVDSTRHRLPNRRFS
jgi:hypothetical protein